MGLIIDLIIWVISGGLFSSKVTDPYKAREDEEKIKEREPV